MTVAVHVALVDGRGRTEAVVGADGSCRLWELGADGHRIGTFDGLVPATAAAALVAARPVGPAPDVGQSVERVEVRRDGRWEAAPTASGQLEPGWRALVDGTVAVIAAARDRCEPLAAADLRADLAEVAGARVLRVRLASTGEDDVTVRFAGARVLDAAGAALWTSGGATTAGLLGPLLDDYGGVTAPATVPGEEDAAIAWSGAPATGATAVVDGTIVLVDHPDGDGAWPSNPFSVALSLA